MSFSNEIKKELSFISINSRGESFSEFYAILLFGGYNGKNKIKLSLENEYVINRIIMLIEKLNSYNDLKLIYSNTKKNNSKKIFTVEIDSLNYLFDDKINITNSIIQNYCCDFLRGVFLFCASMTNPNYEYHLEFNISSAFLYEVLKNCFSFCNCLSYVPSLIKRRNNYVAYIKGSERIIDFLTFIGATQSSMQLIQIKMMKEMRNNINRSINFETANLSKITNSSAEQIQAIKKIKNKLGLDSLPEYLRETAKIRLNNPYVSLQELSKFYKTSISKSGVNHRLKKIIKIANDL